jgi:hypothetical protein
MTARLNSAKTLGLLAGATFAAMTLGVETASASCTTRVAASASATTTAQAFALAIGAWESKVANTMNDLYSDWNYARKKQSTVRVIARKHMVSVSGLPCNT